MQNHLMIDFETLGLTANCHVLSIGCVLFNQKGPIVAPKGWKFTLDQNRAIDAGTVMWWMKQSEQARKALSDGDRVPLRQFSTEFVTWLADAMHSEHADTEKGSLRVWSNGANFDIPILEHILKQYSVRTPWRYDETRCYRTIKAMFKIEDGNANPGVKHDAVDDAKFQAMCLGKWLAANPQYDL